MRAISREQETTATEEKKKYSLQTLSYFVDNQ